MYSIRRSESSLFRLISAEWTCDFRWIFPLLVIGEGLLTMRTGLLLSSMILSMLSLSLEVSYYSLLAGLDEALNSNLDSPLITIPGSTYSFSRLVNHYSVSIFGYEPF
jgi:hypothetical protein